MSYAVFLPSGYDSTRAWPIAFLMDPRGRAGIPLDRLRPTAERLGYVLFSSYNTLSDSATDINERALNAMLTDAQMQFSIDKRRIYLVGFSGTARISWDFGAALGDAVAGIFAAGASGMNFAREVATSRERVPAPAYFGVVGDTDFNYEEMQSFELWLTRQNIPHRIRSFAGGHAWPPDSLFAEAFEWFELRASITGLRPADARQTSAAFTHDSAAAAALEQAGNLADAWQRWREIARDYPHPLAEKEANRLASKAKTRRALQLKHDLNRRFFEFHATLVKWVLDLHRAHMPPDIRTARKALGLDERLRAARAPERDYALAAQRELEHVYVLFSFYEPRTLVQQNKPDHALLLLELAEIIKPGTLDRMRADPRWEPLLRNRFP